MRYRVARALSAALLVAAATLTGCTVTVPGTAVLATGQPIVVENLSADTYGKLSADTLTDAAGDWHSHGVDLYGIRYRQWDSRRGDTPPLCQHSSYRYPAFCADGWMAWDHAWVSTAAGKNSLIPRMYFASAVARAVAFTAWGDDRPAVRTVACLSGAYLSGVNKSDFPVIRTYGQDIVAYARGMASTDPLNDCR